jgi:DNA-binding winged helix-turn-helix (wHTH) protein
LFSVAMSEQSTHSYEFGPFSVDGGRRLLLRNGEPVPLSPKVFETLVALIENRERVLTKDELLQQVWGDTIVEEGGLTRNVSVLRKALGEKPDDHRYIVTVPARGYQFVAGVREIRGNSESSCDPAPALAETGFKPWQGLSARRGVVLGGLAAFALSAIVYVLRPVGATDPVRREIASPVVAPVNAAAYDSVLQARYLSVRTTDADTRAAIALLEHAVVLDPGFAVAYADLAAAYITRLTFVTPEETGDLEQRAFAAAEKALSLDANLAEAYLARGDLLWTHSQRFASSTLRLHSRSTRATLRH